MARCVEKQRVLSFLFAALGNRSTNERMLDRRLCLRGRAQFPQVGRRGKKLERSTRVCRLRRPYASDRSGQCQRCRSPRVRRRCLRGQPMPRAPRESWSIGKEGRGHGRNPRWFVCAS